MLQNEWWDGILCGASVGQEGPDRRLQRAGLGGSTPPHCTAFITPATLLPCTTPCSTTVRLRALIPLFPRVMTMSLSRPAHSPSLSCELAGHGISGEGAHDQQFTLGCRARHACRPRPEGSLSSLVLVRPPRCALCHFFPAEFIF